jgi:hypothetical protein
MSQENIGRAEAVFRPLSQLILWSVPAVLFAAAAYEVTLLLWGSYGGSPGEGVEGERTVAGLASLTMLVGACVAFGHAFYPRVPWAVALFAPAAAAFMVTRYYTYDPYYLPSLRRYSEHGAVGEDWILGMLAAALVVGVLTRLLPIVGSFVTACLLLLILGTTVFAGAGH